MPDRAFSLLVAIACGCLLSSCASSSKKSWNYAYNPGKTAVIINGKAVPPANLPAPVMKAITAGNRIVGKPYKFGGGHRELEDWGYDCSGTVCYALRHAGLINSCGTSSSLCTYGRKGEGKYITVYSRKGHSFVEIAGLRLDTGYNGEGRGPTWSTRPRPLKGYVARHPSGL
jgi:hypothetical protein